MTMTMETILSLLVLVVLSTSRGQTETVQPQQTKNSTDFPQTTATALLPSSDAPTNDTFPTATANRTRATTGNKVDFDTTQEVNGSSIVWTTQPSAVPGSSVSIATSVTGYVVLVVIILAIAILCGIIFFLRRASRTYTFDLQRPPPSSHLNEPTGTFEAVCLNDFDQIVFVDEVTPDGFPPSPFPNGATPRSDEKAPNDQIDTTRSTADTTPQEDTDANAQNPVSSSASTGEDPASVPNDIDLLVDSTGKEEQNEANDPSVCASDLFTEVNLEVVAQIEPNASSIENLHPSSPPLCLPNSS